MIINEFDLGLKSRIKYRAYTADDEIIRRILIDRTEYALFVGCHPKVIFDVGANIGATSILFANSYPDALIYAFEPEPCNFELLEQNVKAYPNVKPYQLALGSRTQEVTLMASDDEYNFGGYSIHNKGVNPKITLKVQMDSVKGFMRSRGVERVDLLKVDTEGCEFEILSDFPSLPPYIMGEAHGVNDGKMIDLLSLSHDLRLTKDFGQRCFPFYALRKPITNGPI